MKFFYWFHYLFIFFPYELIKANLQVAKAVLFPKSSLKPGIIAVPIDLKKDWAIALLANSITLTPGTITLDISADRKTLYVHCLAVENPREFALDIKQVFEKKILRLERTRS